MVQELIPYLPQQLTTTWAAVCMGGIGIGLFFWLLAGVWSRAIITLLAVALGAGLGMVLPRWYHWPINSMAVATLGAVGLGLFAFAVPRLWVGFVLGTMLAIWTCFGAWIMLRPEQPIAWPQEAQMQMLTPPQQAQSMWQSLPEQPRRVLPFAAATGLITGLAIALLWSRLSRAICFSVTGVTVFFIAALTLVSVRRPDWLQLIPAQAQVQAAVLGVMALAGVVIQWQFIPSKKPLSQTRSDDPPSARKAGSGAGARRAANATQGFSAT